MKLIFKFLTLIFLLFFGSCHAQKMMRTLNDYKKLEINEKQFIGKPLKVLLDQIDPQIKSALGDPEMTSNIRLNHISFYFVNKNEYYSRKMKGENPIIIGVTLKRPKGKEYPKLSPTSPWTNEQTMIYGDMIIMRINVTGDN